MEQCLRS